MKHLLIAALLLCCIIPLLFGENRKTDEYTFRTIYHAEDEDLLFAGTYKNGFMISRDNGISWEVKNEGLPHRIVYPFENKSYRTITSISVNPKDSSRIAVTTSFGLYVTENQGELWEEMPLHPPIKTSAYITAVAIHPDNPDRFLIGTSFSGIFETMDRGETWLERKENIDVLYRGAGFYEEISGVAYHPDKENSIYASCGFGKGLFGTDESGGFLEKIPFPGEKAKTSSETDDADPIIEALHSTFTDGKWKLIVTTDNSEWVYNDERQTWKRKEKPVVGRDRPRSTVKTDKREKASERYGIYIGAHNGNRDNVEEYLDFLVEHDFNTLVIDVKNDRGIVTYNTQLDLPKEMGAVYQLFDLEKLLKMAHERGIYVIGRQVVFKDQRLYEYSRNKHAIWDTEEKGPWGHRFKIENEETEEITYEQREYWVDPYSRFVWEYNVSIARELEKRGIDEIQFDYIRFPSDGDLSTAQYRYQKEDMRKTEAIESFLIMAEEALSIPISTDLYGFNSWYRMGNWIGQSIETISHHVDAVCPMFYPSHFPRSFMKEEPYLERAKKIYREGSRRAAVLVGNRSVIRPYVQAFLIGKELEFEKPTYTDYLLKQIEGTNDSPASGFTLWNNSNRYYMVTVPLNSYVQATKKRQDKSNTSPAANEETLLN